MLWKNKKIGLACGLLKSEDNQINAKGDIYRQFVEHFKDFMRTRKTKDLATLVPESFLTLVENFANTHLKGYYNTAEMLKLLNQADALKSFLEIYHSIDGNVSRNDVLSFRRKYKSKIQLNRIRAILKLPKVYKTKHLNLNDILKETTRLAVKTKLGYVFALIKMIRLNDTFKKVAP